MTLLRLGYKEIIKKSIESTTFIFQYKNNIIFHRTNEHLKKHLFNADIIFIFFSYYIFFGMESSSRSYYSWSDL